MTTRSLSLYNCLAPAKLNLFLHVTGRRADGYHLLQTVFQLLNYGDYLHFDLRDDGIIQRTTKLTNIPEASDLIVRAAKLLQTRHQQKFSNTSHASNFLPGANIKIEKRLPLGGGLGGGSSDAATTLMALNHLWQTGLNREQLMQLGLQLGADVPFFIFGQNAFAEGIGEIFKPITTPNGWFVIIEPGVTVPTADIFQSHTLSRNTAPITVADSLNKSEIYTPSYGKNDLQPIATQLFPEIAHAIEWLNTFGNARMTGSGACVFCFFETEKAADAVLTHTPTKWKAWKAPALQNHPLSHLLP